MIPNKDLQNNPSTASVGDRPETLDREISRIEKPVYSPNKAINETIWKLLDLGCPPIPVAPKQDPRKVGCHHQFFVVKRVATGKAGNFVYADGEKIEPQGDYCRFDFTRVDGDSAPVRGDYCRLDENLQPIAQFTGKNPSYIDKWCKTKSVRHQTYQKRMPTDSELKAWFCNPDTGVGTLGGHGGLTWLDFDAKNYPSQKACDRDVVRIKEQIGATWGERTGSGGYRLAVKPKAKPLFTNFATVKDGPHIGEALSEGRFTVLAPSIHPNGNAYTRIDFSAPAEVESLEAIGLFPTKDEIENLSRKSARQAKGKSVGLNTFLDPTDNPLDIRNFAEYLDGFRVEGDWYKAKCPAHNGVSDNSLHINISSGAPKCWGGCSPKAVYQRVKEQAIANGYNVKAKKIQNPTVNSALAQSALEELSKRAESRSPDLLESCLDTPATWKGLSESEKWTAAHAQLKAIAGKLKPTDQAAVNDVVAKALGKPKAIVDNVAKQYWFESEEGQAAIARKAAEKAAQVQQQGLIPFEYDKRGNPELPRQSTVAKILAEHYRKDLAFNDKTNSFWRYGVVSPGVWTEESEKAIRNRIQADLDQSGLEDSYSSGFISGVIELMADRLFARQWNEAKGLICLQNGVLDLSTLTLVAHSPGYRFTCQLPYDYDLKATCEPIIDWLEKAQDGDKDRVEVLRAYLKAVVTRRVDLQRFLEIIGPAGTGKGTYTRLAIALVGMQNTLITSLEQLENNRFETAALYGKMLTIITDSDRYGGSVSNLKALTGQDPLRFERKGEQQKTGFVPESMVLIAANESIQSSDYTSGLERRRLTVPFLKAVKSQQRRDLLTITNVGISGDFVEYLPGLLNWVLALPDDKMKALVRDTTISCPSLTKWKAESLVDSNPIAEWLDDRVVVAPEAKTYVGTIGQKVRVGTGEPGNSISYDSYPKANVWLYANYVEFCSKTGNKPVGTKRFSPLLLDLLRSQLHIEVFKGRDSGGSYFEHIALRESSTEYKNYPRPVTGEMTGSDGSVTVRSIGSDGTDDNDGKSLLHVKEKNNDLLSTSEKPSHKNQLCDQEDRSSIRIEDREIPSLPSVPSLPTGSTVTGTVTTRHNSAKPAEFDLVRTPKGVGVVEKVEGAQAQVRGKTFTIWFDLSEVQVLDLEAL